MEMSKTASVILLATLGVALSLGAGFGVRYYLERIDAAQASLAFDLNPACRTAADCLALVCGDKTFVVGSDIAFDSVQKIQSGWCEGRAVAGRQGVAQCGSYSRCVLGTTGNPTPAAPVSLDPLANLADLEILGVTAYPNIQSVLFDWGTSAPTNARVFISGGGLSSAAFPSVSTLSTKHHVEVTGLLADTAYAYRVVASSRQGVAVEKSGAFRTLSIPLQP